MREKIDKADIIFMSYNYIFNDLYRYIMKIGPILKDSILIVDEAHNILNVCEESKTRSIDYKHVVGSIKRINGVKKKKKEENKEKDNKNSKDSKDNKDNKDKIIKDEEDDELKEIKNIIKEYLDSLENRLLAFFEENENKIKGKEICIINKQILLDIFDYEIFNEINFVMIKYKT